MSAELIIGPEHAAARNAASLVLADTGTLNARIFWYTTQGGAQLAELVLAKPCGSQDGQGRIVLVQDEIGGDLIGATGTATWAEWISADGKLMGAGAVTDQSGQGPFRLRGSSGTALYAGGLLLLGDVVIE